MASDGNMVNHSSSAYPVLLQASWGSTLGEKKAVYLPNIGALQKNGCVGSQSDFPQLLAD